MTPNEEGPMRLQKFLSRAGAASRRAAEGAIVQGRVRVNGETVTELGVRVDPEKDRVQLDGRELTLDQHRWILLNKPAGVVTTRQDPQGRPTVYSLLDAKDRSLPYVGRLDQETEGLLLFTNEGDLLHALTHPSSRVAREYRVIVGGVPTRDALYSLTQGIELEDGLARAEEVKLLKELEEGRGALLQIVLREGRKREVRRLCDAIGHGVRGLRRVRFGPIRLEGVKMGEWRELRPDEVAALRQAVG